MLIGATPFFFEHLDQKYIIMNWHELVQILMKWARLGK